MIGNLSALLDEVDRLLEQIRKLERASGGEHGAAALVAARRLKAHVELWIAYEGAKA